MENLNKAEFEVVQNSLDELEQRRRSSYKKESINPSKVESFIIDTLSKEGFKIDSKQVQATVQRQMAKKQIVVSKDNTSEVPSFFKVGLVIFGGFFIFGVFLVVVTPIFLMVSLVLANLFS